MHGDEHVVKFTEACYRENARTAPDRAARPRRRGDHLVRLTAARAHFRRGGYSHSMVPGGLLVMSSTTRLTSGTSLVMRVEIRSSTS
ncbi:hypothetical protein MAHJHV65_20240 [Mycobacterium avium subsp. hominissuis]